MSTRSSIMKKRWNITSSAIVLLLYLLSGALAGRWWLVLGDDASIWGIKVSALPATRILNAEPLAIALATALPAATICMFARSFLIHLVQIGLALALVRHDIYYLLEGSYFGCDRNGCSAEEGFFFYRCVIVVLSVLSAPLAWLFNDFLRIVAEMTPSKIRNLYSRITGGGGRRSRKIRGRE